MRDLRAADVLVQNAVPLRGDHVQATFRREPSLPRMSFALAGIDDRVFGGLDDRDGAERRRQAPLQFVGGAPQLEQAADRHMAIVDMRMFGSMDRGTA